MTHEEILKGRSIMQLIFNRIVSPTGVNTGLICCIPALELKYAIFPNLEEGNVTVRGNYRKPSIHNSIPEAIAFCQKDFEERVISLFEDSRFGNWKKANNFHGKCSNENLLELWNAFDEEDK